MPASSWSHGLPSQLTIHMVVNSAHAHAASSSWLHEAVLAGLLDCSDIAGSSRVWSLRPFDPQTVEATADADAEVLLLLADVAKMARGRIARRMLSPCVSPSHTAMARRGVRMAWQGSYRKPPPDVEFTEVLRALSPRAAVILGGSGTGADGVAAASSGRVATATHFLREHGIATRRTLLYSSRAGRHRKSGVSSVSSGGEVMRFAASLVDPMRRSPAPSG